MNFQHFIEAQNPVMSTVLEELRAGQKRTHWIWFFFPQHVGLGRSAMANLAKSAREIFGIPDDLKFRSCMTLFAIAAPQRPIFQLALDTFFAGERDPLTVVLLA